MSHNAYDTYASDMMYPEYGLASQNEPLSAFVPAVDHTDIPGVETSVSHSYEAMGNFLNQGHQRVAEDTLDGGRGNTLFIDDIEEPAVTFQLNWTIEEQQKYNLIVQSLDFVERETRLATIHEPSEGTSNWIFESTADSWDMPSGWREYVKWHGFVKWLRSESGVFLILGRAGSGKSTLLKHIVHHKECESLLTQWATVDGSKHGLITATCCFWRAGSDMQKKKEGLYRSLLTQILEKRRDLTPISLPTHWAREHHRGVQAERQSWDVSELKRALSRTLKHNILLHFCFFIDGLDEYSDAYALRELVRDLEEISALTNVKLCITSRPSAIRDKYFEKRPRLTVEKFTQPDIRQYIQLKLESNERFQQLRLKNSRRAEVITSKIQCRSQGIFLWVYLVVERLVTDLEYMGTLAELEKAVESLPTGMEELLDDIMKRLEPDDRMYAARLLLLLLLEGKTELEVGRAYCLTEEHQTPSSVFETNAGAFTHCGDDDDVAYLSDYAVVAEFRVKRWCQDLVEIRQMGLLFPPQEAGRVVGSAIGATHSVHFAHRTVYDYVKKHESIFAQCERPYFNVRRARWRLWLFWIRKFLQAERIYNTISTRWTGITSRIIGRALRDAIKLDMTLEDGDQRTSVSLHSLNGMLISCQDAGPLWPFQYLYSKGIFSHIPSDVQSNKHWILILPAIDESPVSFLQQELTQLSQHSPKLCAQICPYILLVNLRFVRWCRLPGGDGDMLVVIKTLLKYFDINMSAKMNFRTANGTGDNTSSDRILEITLWDELWSTVRTASRPYSCSDFRSHGQWKAELFGLLMYFFDVGAFNQWSTELPLDLVWDINAHKNYKNYPDCPDCESSEKIFQDLMGLLASFNLDTNGLQAEWDCIKDRPIAASVEVLDCSAASDPGDIVEENDV